MKAVAIQTSPADTPPPSGLQARLAVLTTLSPEHLRKLLSGAPERAEPWVRAAAEAGLAEGQVRYGRMLLEGEGAPRDHAAALQWFLHAAQAGDAEGQNMVGRCYENGWGVPAAPAAAAHWFARAADQGHAWARYNLGHLHLDGLGVVRDHARAFQLYGMAAEGGHVRAMNLLARCFEEGWGAEPDPAKARAWYRRSAEGGYFRGQYNFATLLMREGRADEAVAWFSRALEGASPASGEAMARQLAQSAAPALRVLGQRALEAY